MYDTVNMILRASDVIEINPLKISKKLNDVQETKFSDGRVVRFGWLDSLKIAVSEDYLKICKGSLCKWYMGNNLLTMNLDDVRQAIEKLSEVLGLPMYLAEVTRIDVADNVFLDHKPTLYYNHLGESRYCSRLEQPSGIYYKRKHFELVFYDKIKEMRDQRQPIPPEYANENIIRYEIRFRTRINKVFKRDKIIAQMLYDEYFFEEVTSFWHKQYEAITKKNEIIMNFDLIQGRKDLHALSLKYLVDMLGGIMNIVKMINQGYNINQLNRRRADALKKAIRNSNSIKSKCIIKSDLIKELDLKILEIYHCYNNT